MIYPVPPTIDAQSHRCGCGARFNQPLQKTTKDEQGYNVQHFALVCVEDATHDTYIAKHKNTKIVIGPGGRKVEIDMTTGQPVEGGDIIIVDKETALARVDQASRFGMFPESRNKPVTQEQKNAIAIVALAYGLDPLMGEIMPYQGKPYVTIAGRRRKDAEAGKAGRIRFRPLTQDEVNWFEGVRALNPGDLAMYCIITDVNTGGEVEAFARVLAKERDKGRQGAENLPTVQYDIEMVQKRAERRAREMLWGPISRPDGLEGLAVMVEGDEVVEGESRIIEEGEDVPEPLPGGSSVGRQTPPPMDEPVDLPNLGRCLEHDIEWHVTLNRWKKIYASHAQDGGWCKFTDVMGRALKAAWTAQTGTYVKAEVDEWLKQKFDGKTWSKMGPLDMVTAVASLTPTGAPANDPDADAEPEGLDGEGISDGGRDAAEYNVAQESDPEADAAAVAEFDAAIAPPGEMAMGVADETTEH